jgi:hypothetical protein
MKNDDEIIYLKHETNTPGQKIRARAPDATHLCTGRKIRARDEGVC